MSEIAAPRPTQGLEITVAPLADVLEAGRLDRACLDQRPLLLLQRLAELKVERGRPGKPALGEAQIELSPHRGVAMQTGVVCFPLGHARMQRMLGA